MLGNSVKNGCKNFYLHDKPFKFTLQANSYLPSIFRRGPVNLSTLTFLNINLTKTIGNCFKSHRKMAAISIYILPLMRDKNHFLICRHFPIVAQYVHQPKIFGNINLTETITFNCCLEIQSKKAARISVCTLNSLKLLSNQIHIWCQFPVVAR